MNDHVRPCNLKPRRRDLTPVLRRPVEPALQERTLIGTVGMTCQLRTSALVRTAESFAAPASIIGLNFVGANSDSSADPFAILDLPTAPNRICEWRFPRERAGGPTGRRRAGSGSYREDIQ